jgi:hypothetical protein
VKRFWLAALTLLALAAPALAAAAEVAGLPVLSVESKGGTQTCRCCRRSCSA